MTAFLQSLDPLIVLVVLAPLLLASGAWTLRMACSLSAADTPTFWHAQLMLVSLLIANVVLRFFFHVTQTPSSLSTQYLAPVLISAMVIALSLPTGPFSAVVIAVVHAVMIGVIYFGTAIVMGLLPG